jgi:hypothetical protein
MGPPQDWQDDVRLLGRIRGGGILLRAVISSDELRCSSIVQIVNAIGQVRMKEGCKMERFSRGLYMKLMVEYG